MERSKLRNRSGGATQTRGQKKRVLTQKMYKRNRPALGPVNFDTVRIRRIGMIVSHFFEFGGFRNGKVKIEAPGGGRHINARPNKTDAKQMKKGRVTASPVGEGQCAHTRRWLLPSEQMMNLWRPVQKRGERSERSNRLASSASSVAQIICSWRWR